MTRREFTMHAFIDWARERDLDAADYAALAEWCIRELSARGEIIPDNAKKIVDLLLGVQGL